MLIILSGKDRLDKRYPTNSLPVFETPIRHNLPIYKRNSSNHIINKYQSEMVEKF